MYPISLTKVEWRIIRSHTVNSLNNRHVAINHSGGSFLRPPFMASIYMSWRKSDSNIATVPKKGQCKQAALDIAAQCYGILSGISEIIDQWAYEPSGSNTFVNNMEWIHNTRLQRRMSLYLHIQCVQTARCRINKRCVFFQVIFMFFYPHFKTFPFGCLIA